MLFLIDYIVQYCIMLSSLLKRKQRAGKAGLVRQSFFENITNFYGLDILVASGDSSMSIASGQCHEGVLMFRNNRVRYYNTHCDVYGGDYKDMLGECHLSWTMIRHFN